MYDKHFDVIGPGTSDADRVAYLAITGQIGTTKTEWITAIESLLYKWRKQLELLFTLGWPKGQNSLIRGSKYHSLRDCCPATVLLKRPSNCLVRTCKYSRICPWCYARHVQKLYDAMATKCAIHSKLVLITGDFEELADRHLAICLAQHQKRLNFMVDSFRSSCRGVMWKLVINPSVFQDELLWCFGYRLVVSVDRHDDFFLVPNGFTSVGYDEPEPEDVESIIVKFSAYPAGMLDSKYVKQVMSILELKHNLRLSGVCGNMHGLYKGDGHVGTAIGT